MQASSFAQVLGGPYDQFLLCSPTNLQSFHKTWHRPHTTPADFMSMSTALVESSMNLPSVQFLKLVFSSIVTCKMQLCWAHISYFSLREQLCSDTYKKISGKKCLPISLDQNQSLSKIHQNPNVFLQFLPYWQVFNLKCMYSLFFFHCCIGSSTDTYLPMERAGIGFQFMCCIAVLFMAVANHRTTFSAWLLRPRHGWSSRAPVAANRFNAGRMVICWLSDLRRKNIQYESRQRAKKGGEMLETTIRNVLPGREREKSRILAAFD